MVRKIASKNSDRFLFLIHIGENKNSWFVLILNQEQVPAKDF